MIARFSRAAHAAAPSPSLTALLLALVLLAACAPEPPPQERPPRPVRVAEAIRLSTDAERTFSGEVEAPARSRLSFRVPGRLVHRPVEIGTRLKAGQTVAELEATDYRLRTEQASAALERNRAEAREAENNYARIRALYADDNATRSELDRALATLERTRGAAVEAERGLAIARRELGYTRLEASESGVVTDLFAERGENVAAGQAVAELTQEDAPLEVAWPVPEGLIGRFRPGLRVEVAFPALDGVRRQATVEEVGAAPREGRTTFPVVARFAERDPRLRPGMAAEVRVA
ncbi:MAG: efflux RND transporter periplasmic adaptor subunit, partial [Holophagales bacterium]|nr:efflux RND transporter periplasmic adaptor subunit [Holophagales bacterium]